MKEQSNRIDLPTTFTNNFIDYGMEVIENRAIPDIRDGLKPVQRRSLYEYFQSGATSKHSNVKLARLTGNIIGKWHPHGDSAVAETITNMSQEWKNQEPLVSIKGNNGSIYGDPPAHARYIKSRTTPIGDSMGAILSPDIVPYEWNYDETEKMPSILPAQIPVLLMNGATGIAVSLACSIPTHNTGELMDTVIQYLRRPKSTTEELLDTLKGPDFPTGGVIINKSELLNAYETGKGKLRIRGRMRYDKKDHALHVYEVPFTRSGSVDDLIANIAIASLETVNKQGKKVPPKIPEIAKVDNHSGKDGIDIKISLRAGVDPKQVEMQLYALTGLEDTMSYIFTALNDGVITQYGLKQYLHEYVAYQQQLLVAKYEKEKARILRRMEILSGRIILQKVINEVIACAKLSTGRSELETILQTGQKPKGLPREYYKTVSNFRFTELQSQDIAALPIYRISKMDMQAIIDEGKKLQKDLTFTQSMLESELKRRNEIIRHHESIKKISNKQRKTDIIDADFATISKIEMPESPMFVGIDQYNYVRMQEKSFPESTRTTNKSRLSVFDSDGILWNIHLSDAQPTTGRGVLLNQLLPGVEYVGFVTLPETKQGLFIYNDGSAKKMDMSAFMTATKSTKVSSGKIKSSQKLVTYISIPETATTVTVNGQTIPLSKIKTQKISGSGVKCFKPSDQYDILFDASNEVVDDIQSDEPDAWCVFDKDGTLTFDWSMEGGKPDGLYVTSYKDLLTQELVFVHYDGTAKRVDGSQFEVKTKRTSIKCDKDGCQSIYIAPASDTLLATFDTNTAKHIKVSDISKQGKTGGGVRAFYHPKHNLVSVVDGKNSKLPTVSLATQPKPLT